MSRSVHHLMCGCLAVLVLATIADAASPNLARVLPRGAQRGTELEVVLHGDRLADAQEVLLYSSGLTVTKLEVVDAKQVKLRVAVAPDAPLGEHALRVRCATGVSELRTFWVGALPVVYEKDLKPVAPAEHPKIGLDVTVAGAIENEDTDAYLVDVKQGQRLNIEVEGIRLGSGQMLDPLVTVFDDAGGKVVAECDDTPMFVQDPIVSLLAPVDGTYRIEIRDSSYGGNPECHYRMHVGTFPRPRVVYPPGGQAGEELVVTYVGDPAGPATRPTTLPAEPRPELPLLAEQDGQLAPSPNPLRVSPFPNVLEAEPNDDPKSATVAAGALPLAFNGVIDKDGDADFFKFTAKKDQVFDFRAYARAIGSPLDPVIQIRGPDGKGIGGNDDANQKPDSYHRQQMPADGEYTLVVRDHLRGGGPDHVYRVEVTPVAPALTLTIPEAARNSQDRQAIAVPRGNRFATLIRATKADFGGEVALSAEGLPAGVTMACDPVAANVDLVPVVFEAAPGAPAAGALVDLSGKPVDPKVNITGRFTQAVDLIVFGNNVAYYQARVDKLAVAVTDEAPYKLTLGQPKVPLVQSGSMQLKVVAERKDGFKGPIHVRLLWAPPGVGANEIDIKEGETEGVMTINAQGNAAPRKWKTCVLGNADAGGQVWVSSQLIELEVAPPYVGMKIEMAAVEQGKGADVVCTLEQKTKFDGTAKVRLVGLPPNATAPEMEITAESDRVVFPVTADAKTPAGQHKSLFAQVVVTRDGEPILHNVGQGGVLRVDPPKSETAAAPPAPKPDAPKPLSRLEQLRQQAAAQAQKGL